MTAKKTHRAGNDKPVLDPGRKRQAAAVQSDSLIASCAASESFMKASYGDEYNFVESVKVLNDRVKRVQGGDMSGIEAMLVGQAHALQQVFVALMRRASNQEHLKQYQAHMNLGLKAQAQCRATIQALTELKYPRQVVIAKQANVSHGHQQVNNGVSAPAPEVGLAQNELLEVSDGSQTMDIGAAARTGRKDKEVETLDAIDRGQDSAGQDRIE
jgi:hypothetical protein